MNAVQCELGPNPSKEQLVNAVARHFMSQVQYLYLTSFICAFAIKWLQRNQLRNTLILSLFS